MPRIDKNGNIIQNRSDNPSVMNIINNLSQNTKIVIVTITCFLLYFYTNYWNDPFRNGTIPAGQREPNEHEKLFIASDLSFVRQMSDPLTVGFFKHLMQKIFEDDNEDGMTYKPTEEGKELIEARELERAFEKRVDYGGNDGHIAERIDWDDNESIRTTRCSTTRSALTAYYCGRNIAKNNDLALFGSNWKGVNFGVTSLKEYIQCRYYEYKNNLHRHRRSVYRIGIGCSKGCDGFGHAFSIIAQPDGTFLWLQSFIGFYSLSTWMKKEDSRKVSGLSYRLTFDELMDRLLTVDRLMTVSAIADLIIESNSHYNVLFNVDQTEEALRNHREIPWNPDHPLDTFYWDEACEYPLTASSNIAKEDDDDDDGDDEYTSFLWEDQCLEHNMVAQFSLIKDYADYNKMKDYNNVKFVEADDDEGIIDDNTMEEEEEEEDGGDDSDMIKKTL
jgi:hypothetical protein